MSDAETEKRPAFKAGDVVRLRGSDIRMAVEAFDGSEPRCIWMHNGEVRRERFDPLVLDNITLGNEREVEQYRLAYERLKARDASGAESGSPGKSRHYWPRFPF